MPTTQQIACIRTLLHKTGNAAHKETIVAGFTSSRTTSLKELQPAETTALIMHLRSLQTDYNKGARMRNAILAMAHEMHWHLPGTRDVDMKRVDAFCLKNGKKRLDSFAYKELPKLVTQFQQVYKHYLNNL